MKHMNYDKMKVIAPDDSIGLVNGEIDFYTDKLWVDWVKPSETMRKRILSEGKSNFSLVSLEWFQKHNKEIGG